MTDMERVKYDIERCISNVPDACRDCSHYTGTVGFRCMENLMSDAYTLLKEQKPIKPITEMINFKEWDVPDEKITAEAIEKWTFHLCGNCKATLLRTDNYCSKCGRAVEWE